MIVKVDDLEEIEALLIAPSRDITIRCGDYLYDSVEELFERAKGTRACEVEIRSSDPYVIIGFDRTSARLYVGSGDTNASGIFYQLDRILSRCVRTAPWAYTFKFVILANILVFATPHVMWLGEREGFFGLVVAAVFLTWVSWACFIDIWRHSTIWIVRRREERSFIDRNRDQLTIALLAATLGALLGVAATYLVNNIHKSASSKSIVEKDPSKAWRYPP